MNPLEGKKAELAEGIVRNFLDEIIQCDGEDLFCVEMDIEGSVKTGTKVCKPDEYDFSWPLTLDDFWLSRKGDTLINERCKDHSHRTGSACLEEVEWECSKVTIPSGDISLYCVHSDSTEFEDLSASDSIAPRAISEYVHTCATKAAENTDADVSVSKRVYGPAVRFTVADKKIKHKINVDITPRLDLPFSNLKQKTRDAILERVSSFPKFIRNYVRKNGKLRDLKQLYLVPKSDEAWVLSFANYENVIINKFASTKGNSCKKCLRRVKLKLLEWKKRKTDTGKLKLFNISSYLLKTILLQMIIEKPKTSQWSESKLDDNCEEMMRRLRQCAEEGELSAFFDQNINLLENVSNRSRQNLIGFINDEIELSSDESSDESSEESSDESSVESSEEKNVQEECVIL